MIWFRFSGLSLAAMGVVIVEDKSESEETSRKVCGVR